MSAQLAVSVRQAADATSLSERIIRAAINRRDLPARRVGTRLVILTADLEAWLSSHEVVQ